MQWMANRSLSTFSLLPLLPSPPAGHLPSSSGCGSSGTQAKAYGGDQGAYCPSQCLDASFGETLLLPTFSLDRQRFLVFRKSEECICLFPIFQFSVRNGQALGYGQQECGPAWVVQWGGARPLTPQLVTIASPSLLLA